jgi:hypothetical protein
VALVVLLAAPAFAMPQNALPPVGSWAGKTADGTVVTFTVTDDGGLYLEGLSAIPVVGTWTWVPMSNVTGILNCEPADWSAGRPTAYQVVWLGPDRIELSNYYFTVELRRLI